MPAIGKLSKLIINPVARFQTSFLPDYEKFHIIFDEVEEYMVVFEDAKIATFWVSNNYMDSIHFHVPLDIDIIEYIISQMKVREFLNKKRLTNENTEV